MPLLPVPGDSDAHRGKTQTVPACVPGSPVTLERETEWRGWCSAGPRWPPALSSRPAPRGGAPRTPHPRAGLHTTHGRPRWGWEPWKTQSVRLGSLPEIKPRLSFEFSIKYQVERLRRSPGMAERGLSALKSASTAPPSHTSASACPHPGTAAHLPSSRGNPLGGGDVHLAAATIASPAP